MKNLRSDKSAVETDKNKAILDKVNKLIGKLEKEVNLLKEKPKNQYLSIDLYAENLLEKMKTVSKVL